LWHATQRRWKIGETSGQWGGGAEQTVGACTVQRRAPASSVVPPSGEPCADCRHPAPARTAASSGVIARRRNIGPTYRLHPTSGAGCEKISLHKIYAAKKRHILGAPGTG
jgi:hypothetical protein